jgi:hypothetical protein
VVRTLPSTKFIKKNAENRRKRRAFLVWMDSTLPVVLPTQRVRRCAVKILVQTD